MDFAETTLAILVTPDDEFPRVWVAHCLNLDVVTQGESIQHALKMAEEAVRMVIDEDLLAGLDPLTRPKAPAEAWDKLNAVFQSGIPRASIPDESRIAAVAAFMKVSVPAEALPRHALPARPEIEDLPPMWQVAALRKMNSNSAHC